MTSSSNTETRHLRKILFISSRPLYPIIGGDQIRTVQQLELLAEFADVHVVYLSPNTPEEEQASQRFYPRGVTSKCFCVSKWKHYMYTLRGLFNSKPLQVNYYMDRNMADYVRETAADFDAVFCNNIRTAEYARDLPHVTKYLDYVDAISMNYEKAMHKASGLKKLIYRIDFKRCRRYEQLMLREFDSCAVISVVDKNYILQCQKFSS